MPIGNRWKNKVKNDCLLPFLQVINHIDTLVSAAINHGIVQGQKLVRNYLIRYQLSQESGIEVNFIVTAQQQPQPKQQNNHNCSWVETK